MLHEDCMEARRLLDSYLMALSLQDCFKSDCAEFSREARMAQDQLNASRNNYWRHVQKHKCRKT